MAPKEDAGLDGQDADRMLLRAHGQRCGEDRRWAESDGKYRRAFYDLRG